MCTLRRSLLVFLVFVPVQLQGQAPPDARVHDGFYLRFLAGGGPAQVVVDDVLGDEMTFKSNVGGAFHFQIGAAVTENLILFGDLGGFAMTDPDVEYRGATATGENLDVTVSGLGGGVSYYVMPSNFYVSGSVLASTSSLTIQGQDAESEIGPSFLFAVGKEWWVSDSWGLGVALLLELGSMKDKRDPTTGAQADMTTRMFGVAFSATMN